jgi:hypothetical protein
MATTPTLGLTLNDFASGSTTKFVDWRASINGCSTSNMVIIDTFASNISASIVALQSLNSVSAVSGSSVGGGNFGASVASITAYNTNMVIDLKLDTTTSGTTTLNINSLGAKSLQKISSAGSAVNLLAGDLVKNRNYLFKYNGSVWEWIGATSEDQISVAGNPNEIVVLSSASGLTSSGTLLTSLAPASASYVVLSLNPGLSNEYLLSAGTGISISTSTSASTVTVNSTVPLDAAYVVGQMNPTLTNELLLTGGSNISITTNTSASTITVDFVPSASGSNVVMALNPSLTNQWLLTAGSNISLDSNSSASTVTIAVTGGMIDILQIQIFS